MHTRLGKWIVAGLLLVAGPIAAQTFGVNSAMNMPLTVTVAPSGAATVASTAVFVEVNSSMSAEVRANLGYAFKCPGEIAGSTFSVKESLNGATNEIFKLVKGSAHFKGMKAYAWNVTAPIARVASLAAACKVSPKPEHQTILEVRYTCSGKPEVHIFAPAGYGLICQQPPPPLPVTSPPVLVPTPAAPAAPVRQQACRSSISCPQGSTCVKGLCQPLP